MKLTRHEKATTTTIHIVNLQKNKALMKEQTVSWRSERSTLEVPQQQAGR